MGESERPAGRKTATQGWKLFVDAIEETRARGGLKKPNRIGSPKHHLADIELKHLKMAETLRKRLDRQLVANGPDWVPDEGFVESFDKLSNSVTKLTNSLRKSREAEAKARGGLSNDELDAVFKTELRRIVPTFDTEDWRCLLVLGFGKDITEHLLALRAEMAEAVAEEKRQRPRSAVDGTYVDKGEA